MQKDPVERLHQRERAEELRRMRELETKDLAVETERGPRPLEGFAGGHTTWASQQDDEAAREEYGRDSTDVADAETPAREDLEARLEAMASAL